MSGPFGLRLLFAVTVVSAGSLGLLGLFLELLALGAKLRRYVRHVGVRRGGPLFFKSGPVLLG